MARKALSSPYYPNDIWIAWSTPNQRWFLLQGKGPSDSVILDRFNTRAEAVSAAERLTGGGSGSRRDLRRSSTELVTESPRLQRVYLEKGAAWRESTWRPGYYIVVAETTKPGMNLIDEDRLSRAGEQAYALAKSLRGGALWVLAKNTRPVRQKERGTGKSSGRDSLSRKRRDPVRYGYGPLPVRSEVTEVEYHRPPTRGEISRGYGATHYRIFSVEEASFPGTRVLKKWFQADDGLRYYRR